MSSAPVVSSELRAALVAMVKKRVPADEVEDIVQATLADAFASPHAPAEAEPFRRWVFGVAKNKVVDYHRRSSRETFEVPELAGKPAPHAEVDMLRWAEQHLPPGEENRTTLDWMLREGDGEKLEWIAESEKLPAPRVRQRVSRLRRHLKDHWKKEVALLAAVGVLITGVLFLLRPKPAEEIANEDVARAADLRKHAIEQCLASDWKPCLEGLDQAKRLDPAGDTRPEVRQARENAERALRPAPAPTTSATTSNLELPPVPTAPAPTAPAPKKAFTPPPFSTESSVPSEPSPLAPSPSGTPEGALKSPKARPPAKPTATALPSKPAPPTNAGSGLSDPEYEQSKGGTPVFKTKK